MTSLTTLLASLPTGPVIAGHTPAHDRTFSVTNPATGEVLAEVGDATAADTQAAMDAACAAAKAWADTTARERAEILRRAYDLIVERAEDFAALMTAEMGKPLIEARGEVTYGAEFFRWFSEEAVRVFGQAGAAPVSGKTLLTIKKPVGPVYAITPWNFPLAMATRKIAPALAAGCTVVLKPAGLTPLTALLLMEVLAAAGVPDGVVSCVTTSDSKAVSEVMFADERLRKLTFTGSTGVGQQLLKQAADQVLRTSMELGGNAPFVILPSARVEVAVAATIPAKMRNNGQACTAANRIYVPRALAEDYLAGLVRETQKIVVGDGAAESTNLGPLITQEAVEGVQELVDEAVAAGATVAYSGEVPDGPGCFMPPVILTDIPAGARILAEEIFGPVAPVVVYDDVEEALTAASDTPFGLMAYVIGDDLREIHHACARIESGMIAVNTGVISDPAAPFGGVKASGLGREGSHEGIAEYLETIYIGIDPTA